MALYDYKCSDCGDVTEELIESSPMGFLDVLIKCEKCGGASERIFNPKSAATFRLIGKEWAKDGYGIRGIDDEGKDEWTGEPYFKPGRKNVGVPVDRETKRRWREDNYVDDEDIGPDPHVGQRPIKVITKPGKEPNEKIHHITNPKKKR